METYGHADDLEPFETGWHAHEHHQLLYAAQGTLTLEVGDGSWLLPPQRAAWIGAGVSHWVASRGRVRLRTVYFEPALEGPGVACSVFAMPDLGREMVLHAMRWPRACAPSPLARAFFEALSGLCAEWNAQALPLRLPRGRSEALRAALRYATAHIGDGVTLEAAARAAGVSSRTLTRRFAQETGTTWRHVVRQARVMRAMELLVEPDARVTDVAYAVGFESIGAFSHAFRAVVGEPPSVYRARALGDAS